MLKNILTTFAIVLAILAWTISLNMPASAQSCPVGTPIGGCGDGGGGLPPGGPSIQPAPAPIAGAGLLYLVAAAGGGYVLRRWRSTSKNKL